MTGSFIPTSCPDADPAQPPVQDGPMSYPAPGYLGDAGAATAVFRPAGTPPELAHDNGGAAYLATGASTHGRFGLYRWDMGPTPSGPAPHFHRTISESFYVLSGAVRLFDGREWVEATTGDFLHVPEGGVHGFRNESGQPACMLLLFTPGAPREDYFETLADAARREAMTGDDWTAFFTRHDTFWT
jgi:mannose-6-phosphate isomerase-like protein (cupin superfamily)